MRENDEVEEMVAVQISPDALYQQDKATVDIQISTAKLYPRSIERCKANSIAVVSMDKDIAAECTYALSRFQKGGGKKTISGPSVNLAKILAQNWGNMRIQAKVVSIEDKQITSQGTAWDLENNVAIQVEVKRSIMSKTGRYSDDMIVVTGNACNAIALRNAILAVIPKGLTKVVYKAALDTITGDISDENKLKGVRRKVVDGLIGAYKVTEKEILDAIGRASIDHITGDDIAILIGMGTAIKEGDTTVEDTFKSKPVVKTNSDKEKERIQHLINDSTTPEDLAKHEKAILKYPELKKVFDDQMAILQALNK